MTISDSATGMSKGVWVSSAWVAIRKIVNPTICVMMNGLPIQSTPKTAPSYCAVTMPWRLSVPAWITTPTMASTIGSS